MKKNYVVIRQMFYQNFDKIDCVCAIDGMDVESFSSKQRALEFIQQITKHHEIPFVECKHEIPYSRTKATSFAQQVYNKSGYRCAYLLVENYVNDEL